MAIVFQRASRSYSARTAPYTVSGTINSGITVNKLKVSLTRESWPEGPLADIVLTFPDNNTAGFSVAGGVVLDRQGNVLLESSLTIEKFGENGLPVPFPTGSYTLDFYLHQNATSAVKIERF